MRRLTEQGQDLMVLVRHEAGAFAQTSRRVRRKLVRGVDRVEDKLADLETLYDLVHGEVEDAALDVAATLRSVRRGNGMLGPGPAPARGRPVMRLARLALAFAGVGLVLLALPDAAYAWTPGTHIYLGESVLVEPGPAPGRRRPTCSAPTRSTSSTATSPPTPRSRSTTRRSAAIVTTGTSARRSTTWPRPTRSAPSGWATSATSPPTPSPTTTSCRASS